MKLFLKRLLCFILVIQLSGCAQATIQQRQAKHSTIGEKYSAIEAECTEENQKDEIKALESFLKCMQEKALPMLEEQDYPDRDIITASLNAQLAAVHEFQDKKISKKKLKKEKAALLQKIAELKQSAVNARNSREAERVYADQRSERIAAGILAVALVGAAVYYGCKDGSCGGGGSSYSSNHQGCCSYHNGVAGTCYAGRVMCNDGQLSPTCRC